LCSSEAATDALSLFDEVSELRREAHHAATVEFASEVAAAHVSQRASAANLAAYLAVRRRDLRATQLQLARLGLSALGNMEAGVLRHLDAVLRALARLSGDAGAEAGAGAPREPGRLLRLHARAVLGPPADGHSARIMVTMPSESDRDGGVLAAQLVRGGMSIARINTAHDSPAVWERMAGFVRRAAAEQGANVKLSFDLPGPKLRVSDLAPIPTLIRVKPRRDARGRTVALARVFAFAECDAQAAAAAASAASGAAAAGEPSFLLPLAEPGGRALIARAAVGDMLEVREDARGRRRRLDVSAICAGFCALVAARTCLLAPQTEVRLRARGREAAAAAVGSPPPARPSLRMRAGDVICFQSGEGEGCASAGGAILRLQAPRLFERIAAPDRVLLDDGRLEGAVERVSEDRGCFWVRLSRVAAPPGGAARLRPGEGLSFPDTDLDEPAMDAESRAALASLLPLRPDAVALSFAQSAEDVADAQAALDAAPLPGCGLLLKLETARAFRRLPALLFASLRRPGGAVMLARGDLAPAVGWARLVECSEQCACLCEAAHTPLVWATQVMEQCVKTGVPSRAEVADAALGSRAEAFMLNKGGHVVEAMGLLDEIHRRMAGHEHKHRNLLRRLRLCD